MITKVDGSSNNDLKVKIHFSANDNSNLSYNLNSHRILLHDDNTHEKTSPFYDQGGAAISPLFDFRCILNEDTLWKSTVRKVKNQCLLKFKMKKAITRNGLKKLSGVKVIFKLE